MTAPPPATEEPGGSSQLEELYRSESRDHLQRLGRAVLALERGGGRTAVDEAFRSAHTLKGMAAAMGHDAVVRLAHSLEHLLERIRSGTLEADGELVDLILRGVDELGRVVEEVLSPDATATDAASAAVAGSRPPGDVMARDEGTRYVRVEQDRIDSLMDRTGELLVARERLLRTARAAGHRELRTLAEDLARSLDELREDALRLRLAPVGELEDRLRRTVRDAARALEKDVRLDLEDLDVEIDRSLLPNLADLLTHLIRNAVDHGVEHGAEREAAGKSRQGWIRVSSQAERDTVIVRVEDDGGGIDVERVLRRAREMGLQMGHGSTPSDAELLQLLVRPGFSTASEVTELSGRGVGLDEVASGLRRLGGELSLTSRPGRGALFAIELPKTLSLTRVLLIGIGDEVVGIPSSAVERVEEVAVAEAAEDERSGSGAPGQELAHLARLCGYGTVEADGGGFVVVLGRTGRASSIRVDALLGLRDVVIKRFPVPRGTRDLFAGAAVLSDGRPRLVIDPGRLLARAQWNGGSQANASSEALTR